MSGEGDSRPWKPPIGAAAKAAFLAALRSGAPRQEAAAAGGYALNSFYRVARGDPAFRAAWDAAHAVSAEAERRRVAAGGGWSGEGTDGETRIVSNNRRVLQRRKMRHVRFDAARQQAFLAHFGWSCDAIAAAAEAGVCERTVYVHRRKDSVFAEEFQQALEQGYVRLEVEAVRQRLAAQHRLREAIEGAEPTGAGALSGEAACEFARGDLAAGPPEWRHGRQKRMSFDDAIELLDKKLRALGVRHGVLPPEGEGPA